MRKAFNYGFNDSLLYAFLVGFDLQKSRSIQESLMKRVYTQLRTIQPSLNMHLYTRLYKRHVNDMQKNQDKLANQLRDFLHKKKNILISTAQKEKNPGLFASVDPQPEKNIEVMFLDVTDAAKVFWHFYNNSVYERELKNNYFFQNKELRKKIREKVDIAHVEELTTIRKGYSRLLYRKSCYGLNKFSPEEAEIKIIKTREYLVDALAPIVREGISKRLSFDVTREKPYTDEVPVTQNDIKFLAEEFSVNLTVNGSAFNFSRDNKAKITLTGKGTDWVTAFDLFPYTKNVDIPSNVSHFEKYAYHVIPSRQEVMDVFGSYVTWSFSLFGNRHHTNLAREIIAEFEFMTSKEKESEGIVRHRLFREKSGELSKLGKKLIETWVGDSFNKTGDFARRIDYFCYRVYGKEFSQVFRAEIKNAEAKKAEAKKAEANKAAPRSKYHYGA